MSRCLDSDTLPGRNYDARVLLLHLGMGNGELGIGNWVLGIGNWQLR
ncbi:MAG: hypothetical protein F6K47_35200 [Symploca sp. SIO2E6]|nr:hypothetical protein [Symploca sp. SIO2E6]